MLYLFQKTTSHIYREYKWYRKNSKFKGLCTNLCWSFVAHIDHEHNTTQIFYQVFGFEIPSIELTLSKITNKLFIIRNACLLNL
jgi:hypothetical protein